MVKYIPEPFRIKMVENIKMLTREERCDKIREASYNLFRLKGEDVYIDTLTDSGTNAMSLEMWSGLLRGDEAYAGAKSYYRFIQACQDVFGYGFFCPVHQGRAAEKVLFPNLLHPGTYALANLFFDTTRGHVVLSGARALECVCEEAKHPELVAPFKGNMDTALMEQTILEKGPENVGLVVMTLTNNSAGGQPVSMANLREVSRICQKYGIPLCIDAARYAENAMFIKQREAGYADKSIPEIVRECFSYADMFTMSAKKDTLVNMGGVIGIKDPDSPLIPGIKANCISFEGFYTYGGLNGRDLECLAVGLYEGMDESYLTYRLGSIAYLGGRLDELGIPYQSGPERGALQGVRHPCLRHWFLHDGPGPGHRGGGAFHQRIHPSCHPPPGLHPVPFRSGGGGHPQRLAAAPGIAARLPHRVGSKRAAPLPGHAGPH